MNYLNDNDKIIFKTFKNTNDIEVAKKMSIFSNLGEYKSIDGYKYFESYDNEPIYFLNQATCYDIFIDKYKKILFGSRYFFFDPVLLEQYLNGIIPILNNIELNNVISFDCNIIAISKWFSTYGHYKDEVFNLYNFFEKQNLLNNDYKCLVDFVFQKNHINYSFDNYNIINNYLFNNNIINAYHYPISKMNKVILIEHKTDSDNFHTFPINSKNKIMSNIQDLNLNYKNIFITRGKALHLPRNFNNQKEIEELLINNEYNLVNPELMNIELFINSVKNADNVFITWGGALVNLIYLKEHTNVYILRSKSYKHEPLELFKFLSNKHFYNLNIHIIDSDIDDNIDPSKILQFIV